MRTALVALLAGMFLTLGGCRPSAPAVDYAPASTLREIMESIVEPSADVIWDSFAIIITAKGEEQKMPRTDEEWLAVRSRAVTLVEAANLLLIPNRHVAKPGEAADNPEFERDPKDIEGMMAQDRAKFLNLVGGFREAASTMLAAVDAKDLLAIERAGETLDVACENCHETYWYLPDK
jgi:cytochrome c556